MGYHESRILSFIETWLHFLDPSAAVPDFRTIRSHRNVLQSSKKKEEGGIALYVSERWCNPRYVNVKERFCDLDFI